MSLAIKSLIFALSHPETAHQDCQHVIRSMKNVCTFLASGHLMYRLFVCGFFCLSGMGSLLAQGFLPDSRLTKYIEKQMEIAEVPGLSLVLVDQHGIIWAEGFGYSQLDQGYEVSPRTIFRTASITKLFTGIAIMQLYEAEKLDLDVPVRRYLPDFMPLHRFEMTDSITIRHLLTHHSGLPSDIMYRYFHPDPPPYQSALTYLNQEYLSTLPNTILSYSNVGYSLLGMVIEAVSGKSYEDYIRQYILAPLRMKQSDFVVRPDMKGRYAQGYQKGLVPFEEPPARDIPAMMLHSSAAEMANFMQMVLNQGRFEGQQLLSPAGMAEMLRPQNEMVDLDYDESIGLSFFLTHENGIWGYAGGSAEHGGDTFVYHANLILLPKVGLGVAVLTNGEEGGWVSYTTARSVLQSALFQLRSRSPQPIFQHKVKRRKVAPERLQPLAGTYFFGAQPVEVIAKKRRVEAHYDDVKLHLIPNARGAFYPRVRKWGFPVSDKTQEFRFERIGHRQVLTMTYAYETELLGVKQEVTPINDTWLSYVGTYDAQVPDSLDMLKYVRLEMKQDFLFLTLYMEDGQEGGTQALKPLNDSTAIVYGLGRSTGNTIHVRQQAGQLVLSYEGTYWTKPSPMVKP